MTAGIVNQLAALRRIAAFSAGVRGHELCEWRTGKNGAQASCTHCGAGLRVYVSALHPEMDGPALGGACGQYAVAGRAA